MPACSALSIARYCSLAEPTFSNFTVISGFASSNAGIAASTVASQDHTVISVLSSSAIAVVPPANRRDEAIVALNTAQITLLFMLFLLHFSFVLRIMCHVFAKTCYLYLFQIHYRQDSLKINFPFNMISSDDIPAISLINRLTANIPTSIFGVAIVESDGE